MLEIFPIPAFRDNYFWLLQRGKHAAVVDPGDAAPVIRVLENRGLILDTILITHHHSDHVGGVPELLNLYRSKVYAPLKEQYDFAHQAVKEGDAIHLETLDLQLGILELPGHTLGHVAYYGANSLFCGDTLFGCGCGRLFEGTHQQLFASLQKLAKLPSETAVYCAHEYTEHNIRFARTLDPQNAALASRQKDAAQLREADKPTLPSTIGLELETNPFLRCHTASIKAAAGLYETSPHQIEPEQVFGVIREMRNQY